MKKYILIVCLSWGTSFRKTPSAESYNTKRIKKLIPLSAQVFLENTTIGTVTDEEGIFRLERTPDTEILIISYIGFKTDTLKISSPFISHQMIQNQEDELDEVTLTQRRRASQKS